MSKWTLVLAVVAMLAIISGVVIYNLYPITQKAANLKSCTKTIDQPDGTSVIVELPSGQQLIGDFQAKEKKVIVQINPDVDCDKVEIRPANSGASQ